MKPVFAALLLAPLLFAATATKSKSASSTASSKAKTTSHSTHSSKKARHTARKRRPARRPSYQTQPTADRYKDIQQALADKGYFKGDVTGKWGPDSSDALQRFQTDNKLPNDGKINSLSIIQLGLGPKRDPITPVATPPVTPVVPTSPSPSAPTVSDPPTEAPPSPAPAQQ